MSKTLIVISDKLEISSNKVHVDLPESCPWCHANILPTIEGQSMTSLSTDKSLPFSLILMCQNCKKHFSASYTVVSNLEGNGFYNINKLLINNDVPLPKPSFEYPDEINTVSSEFSKIIAQSSHAEGLGLNHLAGIGFRKALEFLVKDYLIKYKGLDENTISKKQLGKCISENIDDSRLQSLAKAATWIGNDETHYVRKHDDRDIHDMKKFLHKMTLFISYELAVEDATEFTS